jgi:hypothetical protein
VENELKRNDNSALPATMKIGVKQKDGHDVSLVEWTTTLNGRQVHVAMVVDPCELKALNQKPFGQSFSTPVGIALIQRP